MIPPPSTHPGSHFSSQRRPIYNAIVRRWHSLPPTSTTIVKAPLQIMYPALCKIKEEGGGDKKTRLLLLSTLTFVALRRNILEIEGRVGGHDRRGAFTSSNRQRSACQRTSQDLTLYSRVLIMQTPDATSTAATRGSAALRAEVISGKRQRLCFSGENFAPVKGRWRGWQVTVTMAASELRSFSEHISDITCSGDSTRTCSRVTT